LYLWQRQGDWSDRGENCFGDCGYFVNWFGDYEDFVSWSGDYENLVNWFGDYGYLVNWFGDYGYLVNLFGDCGNLEIDENDHLVDYLGDVPAYRHGGDCYDRKIGRLHHAFFEVLFDPLVGCPHWKVDQRSYHCASNLLQFFPMV